MNKQLNNNSMKGNLEIYNNRNRETFMVIIE